MGDRQKMTVKISNDTTQAFTQDMTAIDSSGTSWKQLVKNSVNCWKLPMGTISSQALPVMV